MNSQTPQEMPPLARGAGAFLLAASLFALASIVSFGVFGPKSVSGWLLVGLGAISVVLWGIGRAQARKYLESVPLDAAGKSRALLGINAVTSVLLVGVVLVGINYIAGRHHKTFDLTRNHVNSLAEQTYNALQALPRPVTLNYYYYAREVDPVAQSLFDNYKRASNKIRVNYVNAALSPVGLPATFRGQPLVVAQLEPLNAAPKAGQKPKNDGTTTQEVSVINEQGITSALLKLAKPKSAKLYTLTGHGEVDFNQLPGLKSSLEAQNYSFEMLSLLQTSAKIPSDAAALIVAAPQVDLSANEAKLLKSYLNAKGRLVLLMSPLRNGKTLPGWSALLKAVGVQAGAGYVLDTTQAYKKPEIPVGLLTDTTRHPILSGTNGAVVFPASSPLKPLTPAPAGVTFTPLFESSASAQATSGGEGPFVLAGVATKGDSRVLVVASEILASDDALTLFGNRSFLLSGINWTVGNDSLVSIPPKTFTANTLNMPTPTARFASLFSLLVMPFLALLAGTLVWFMRR